MVRASRQSGRISFLAIAGLLSVMLVGVLFAFNGTSPRTAAAEFMSALAKGDVDKLTDLSIVHDKGRDEIRKEWSDAIKYSRSYFFLWQIVAVSQEKDAATVRLDVTVNPISPSAYPEHKELSLQRVGSTWKVDVPLITRDMYPYLPQ